LDEAQARRILEHRQRTSNAHVASIKVLIELDKAAKAEAEPEPSAFERLGLYDDEFSTRRRQKAGSS
jgi:hypothetical protein